MKMAIGAVIEMVAVRVVPVACYAPAHPPAEVLGWSQVRYSAVEIHRVRGKAGAGGGKLEPDRIRAPGRQPRTPHCDCSWALRRAGLMQRRGALTLSRHPHSLCWYVYPVCAAWHCPAPQPAEPSDWNTDPFVLTGQDGFLYGRGASDNKGTLLAAIFAAALCRHTGSRFGEGFSDGRADDLDGTNGSAHGSSGDGKGSATGGSDINFVFIIEGEGENGSTGFQVSTSRFVVYSIFDMFFTVLLLQFCVTQETVRANLGWFPNTTVVMNNNSKWLTDDRPCLTYGLRGRLCCDVEVRSTHSLLRTRLGLCL